ncbi:citrate synthase/methylcitrate synthase [Cytobacillus sp. FJAT-53684]|uniref:Citrate synthase n=1 Tax=Cytobacillus mangrovibacter TaxID=3299024 RepID=A0ABW6K1M9_9BACI
MIHYGLKGVIAAETGISHVDGEKGQLIYRGYEIGEIIDQCTFEEAAYLLWYGEFPTGEQLHDLKVSLVGNRQLPSYIIDLIVSLPDEMDLMSALRTILSAEGRKAYRWKPTIEQAIRMTAMAPTIIAFRRRHLEGKTFIPPKPELNHVENYLYMLKGEVPTKAHVNALETYMILTMEHGMNASTFSARVTASTESDIVSAITSAIGTMKGPLHGGAPSEVISLLNEVNEQGDAEKVIRNILKRGKKLMGFGHRIYKTIDPRSVALKSKLKAFSGEDKWLDLSMKVEKLGVQILEEVKPGRSLYTNVEFYAAAIMKAVQMEKELFTPTFTASRIVGWSAHILEQAENNVIFRPQSKYIGPIKKKEDSIQV